MATIETFDRKHREIIDGLAQYLCARGGVDWSFSGAKFRWREDAERLINSLRELGTDIGMGFWTSGLWGELIANDAARAQYLRDPVAYNEVHP